MFFCVCVFFKSLFFSDGLELTGGPLCDDSLYSPLQLCLVSFKVQGVRAGVYPEDERLTRQAGDHTARFLCTLKY